MAANSTNVSRDRWTVEQEDKLVELWQQHECLFNVSCKTYHKRTDREKSWAEIALALAVPVEKVKTRATTLRTQYAKLLKPKPSGSEEKALTLKQRWLLTSLDFLRKHDIQRSTETSLDQSVKDAMAAQQNTDDTISDPDDMSEMSDDIVVNLSTTASEPYTQENYERCSPILKPVKMRNKVQTVDSLEKRKLDLLQEMSVAIQKPAADCDGTFGNQVAEELRLIKNLVIKTRLKRKIMNDVYDAQECDQPVSMPSSYLPSSYLPSPMCPPPPPVQVPPIHTPLQSLPHQQSPTHIPMQSIPCHYQYKPGFMAMLDDCDVEQYKKKQTLFSAVYRE